VAVDEHLELERSDELGSSTLLPRTKKNPT